MDDSLKLEQVNLVVRDMDAAVAFYRRLGLNIPDAPAAWAEWDPHHRNAVKEGDAVEFELDSRPFAQQWNPGIGDGRAVLTFRTPDRETVDKIHADLTGAGYRSQLEPWDAFWGARFAIVEDPDGNAVGLMSPMDPSRRTETPPPPSG